MGGERVQRCDGEEENPRGREEIPAQPEGDNVHNAVADTLVVDPLAALEEEPRHVLSRAKVHCELQNNVDDSNYHCGPGYDNG